MGTTKLTLTVKVAWWVRPYLRCAAFVASAMGLEPNMEEIGRTVMRGVKIKA